MRPYLAILRDSVREAMSSRTLPFLLVFFTIALVALAPIGLQQDVPWRLALDEITDQTLWLAKIRQQAKQGGDTPGKRLLERLSEHAKASAGLGAAPPDGIGANSALLLTNAVNSDVLPDRSFYSEDAWRDVPLSREARDLIERDPAALPERDLKRLNRLLLSAAWPGALKTPTDSRAKITYLGFEIPGLSGQLEQFVSETEAVRRIVRQLIYAVCVWGIGPVGLLVGIIVTAEIMPRTFEPGAIDLLLSKPVSRVLVFLTKFAGACAFILISFTYLVLGLWLIFGLRLGVWAPQLLGAIPLFLFSFAVIFSVSAVTGLRWRSPIVSVMVTVLVWGAAFLLGLSRDVMKELRADERVRQITVAGDSLLVADFERSAYVWSEPAKDWQEQNGLMPRLSPGAAANPLMRPKLLGPFYDAANDRLVVAESGPMGDNVLHFSSTKAKWKTTEGAKLPPGTENLFVTRDGRLLAAGRAGLFEFRGDPTVAKKEFMIFGVFDLVPEDARNVFVRVDDREEGWGEGVAVDLDPTGQTAAIFERGRLLLLRRHENGKYESAAERRLFDEKQAQPAIISVTNDVVSVALKDGTIRLLKPDGLRDLASERPFGEEIPRTSAVSPDGRYLAVLFHSGDVWLRDLKTKGQGASTFARPSGQGDISAISFDDQGRLLTSDRLRRVTRQSLPDLAVERRYSGSLPMSEKIYRFALTPLSWLLPDTYGLRSVYSYLFTDLKSESTTADESDIESRRIRYELRRPIAQNVGFLVVVLGLASAYVMRKDF